jgi:hypothetical protein
VPPASASGPFPQGVTDHDGQNLTD